MELVNINSQSMTKSCYIHIPFCNKICSYCDFCKIYYNKNLVKRYLDSLKKEIELNYNQEVLNTIYIGGGTPSSLDIKELEYLFKILNILKKDKNIEFTIEGNFESTTKEKLDLYKKYGINRLSFGIESTDKDNLKFLERNLDKEKVKEVLDYAKQIGISNINVDLIYAIPNETNVVLSKDIEYILSLNIPHISTYSLIIEDNTKLKINNEKNIAEEKDFEMYKLICKTLKDNNYNHYEISNFSKEGYESQHNTCYWNNDRYYGFGLGASSYINNIRSTNTRSITKYLKNDYIYEKEELSETDEMEYEVILNLRKKDGINLKQFKEKYNIDLINVYNYKDLLENKLLSLSNNNLSISEDKWYISNEIIVKLLGCEVK